VGTWLRGRTPRRVHGKEGGPCKRGMLSNIRDTTPEMPIAIPRRAPGKSLLWHLGGWGPRWGEGRGGSPIRIASSCGLPQLVHPLHPRADGLDCAVVLAAAHGARKRAGSEYPSGVRGALGAGGYLRPWQPRSRGSDKSRLDDRVLDDQRRHLSFSTSFGRPGPQFGAQPYIRFSPRRERSTSARDVVLADSALAPIMPVASGGNWVPCQKGVGIGPVVGR